MLASGIAVIGCSSDNIPDAPDKILEAGTKFYVKVAIADANGSSTRAPGEGGNDVENNYTDGETFENTINKVLFVFYDIDGKYVAAKDVTDFTKEPTGSNNINALVDIIVPVTLQQDSKTPAYVVAYVNPTNDAETNKTGDITDIQTNTRTLQQIVPTAQGGNNAHGFLMTNSVYYEVGAAAPVVATPVPAAVLYAKKEDALKDDAEGMTIYVERVVSKITVNKKNNDNNNPIPDNNPEVKSPDGQTTYKLDFEEKAWGMNNEEPSTYVLKNFRTGTENMPSSITNLSYSEANKNSTMLSLTNPDWNYPAVKSNPNQGRRSFWAYSPYYFNTTKYPEFADQYNANKSDYPLNQTKFIDIWDTENNVKGDKGILFGSTAYTLENTVSYNTLAEPKAGERAVSTVLIVGKYKVLNAETNEEVPYDNIYIRRGTEKNIIYINDDFMMRKFLETQTTTDGVIFNKIIGADNKEQYIPVSWSEENKNTIANDFEIVHPAKDVTGSYTASRYISLQLTGNGLTKVVGEGENKTTENVYYYIDTNGNYQPVTADILATKVNPQLYKFFQNKLGAVEEFNGGYAYFKVPVRHLWGRNLEGFGDITFDTPAPGYTLGQYGVVRNHTYNISIDGISGIGTGISNPEDPIVFPVKEKEYFVKTQIRVQRWRIVPQQSVILK